MIGKTFGRYEIVDKIGRGGMGEVYRARDTRLGRDVALKFIPAALFADKSLRTRFEREARSAGSLNHPNIVTIHELGEHDGRLFIAMELVDGAALRRLIDERPLALDDAIGYSVQVAEGLAKAHAAEITHRDIKPGNIVVDTDGRCRLLDFGLASLSGATQLTAENTTIGTIAYMSPEQLSGAPADSRSDLWSLGVVLYEMIAGRAPFRGENAAAVAHAINSTDPEPITAVRTGVPRDLERIVHKLLQKDPARRYQTAGDLLVDLRTLHEDSTSRPTTRSPKRRRGLVGFALLVFAAVAALWWFGRDGATGVAEARSVAVLPFANMSPDPNDEYFSDGLSEELLGMLARVQGLRVAARTSSFQFKGHTGNVEEIGRELGVSVILEGSVRRSGNQLKITVQMVDARDGLHVWSHTYDREMGDVFAIQEDIANRVVEAMRLTLLGEDAERMAKAPTDNLEAYDAYLLGRHLMARRTSDALLRAEGHFRQAVELDPEFALAYAGLADTYLLLSYYANRSRNETIQAMVSALDRALELSDELGEAYAALGMLRVLQGRALDARVAFERAIELSPSYATAYQWYGNMLTGIETIFPDPAKASEMLRKAAELDPLSPIILYSYANDLVAQGRYEDAFVQIDRVIELDPASPLGYLLRGFILHNELGQVTDALEWWSEAVDRDPGNLESRMLTATGMASLGRFDEALAFMDSLATAHPDIALSAFALGQAYRYLGRHDDAFVWFRRAAEIDPADKLALSQCNRTLLALDGADIAASWAQSQDVMTATLSLVEVGLARGDFDAVDAIQREVGEVAGALGEGFIRDQLALGDLARGRFESARARYAEAFPFFLEQESPVVSSSYLTPAISLAAALIGTGETARAQLLLGKAEERIDALTETQRLLDCSTELMRVYALQGRTRDALDVLKRRLELGVPWRWYQYEHDPHLTAIRDEPEFKSMMVSIRDEVARQRNRIPEELLVAP